MMFDKLQQFVTAGNRGQMGGRDLPGMMIVLVIAGVIGFVGIQVMSTVISTTSLGQNDSLYSAQTNLTDAVNDAWGLVGVAFLVIILSVIIIYLYGLRSGR